MKSMWQSEARAELLARAEHLQPAAPATVGENELQPNAGARHRRIANGNGELPVAPKTTPLKFTPIKQLIIYWLPFPKGVPTAPELIARTPGEWDGEVRQFQEALQQFAANSQRTNWPEHPAFGKLTTKDWGVLVYRHIDHHFKQFGV